MHPQPAYGFFGFSAHLRNTQGFEQQYLPNGEVPISGTMWAQHALSETLKTLAKEGAESFSQNYIWQNQQNYYQFK